MARPARRRRRGCDEQRQLAEDWLRRLGRPVTAEAIEVLAPHVRLEGKPELIELQAFARLVRRGQVPTAAGVRGEVAAQLAREERVRRQQDQLHAVVAELETFGRAVATEVSQYRAREGRSPTWRELGRSRGWSQEVLEKVMARLCVAGWVTYDPQPGSLRPGPAFQSSRQVTAS